MLKKGVDFIDQIDSLTERKIKSMEKRSMNRTKVRGLEDTIKLIREKRIKWVPTELFS